jgi:hypothetical protein
MGKLFGSKETEKEEEKRSQPQPPPSAVMGKDSLIQFFPKSRKLN